MNGYRIGELADATDLSTETIRYYEKIGLMPQAIRHSNGYRVYGHDAMTRLGFISRAKSVGFTLNEIGALLSLSLSSVDQCRETEAQSREKILVIDSKIDELRGMKLALEQLVDQCKSASGDSSACPILDYFENGRS